MMSFTDWLMHFKNKKEENATTIEDKRHIKSMWQKEKLAAALEEEDDEIPEEVFEMAVNSITQEDDLASESLAEIYLQQGKHDKAIEMYKKLSLRNPEKNAYFALKIKDIIKEK
jgi:tetratricopeptide (TPR) repeat protein